MNEITVRPPRRMFLEIPPPGDDRGWAAYWGNQALKMHEQLLERAHFLDELHLVRATRLAWWHACRVGGYRYWDPEWRRGEPDRKA